MDVAQEVRDALELTDGSDAIVRGALAAGCNFFAGYPTPPASSILADMVRALIELKADVNVKTKGGNTPLKAAQKGDQEDIIAILKEAGAKK